MKRFLLILIFFLIGCTTTKHHHVIVVDMQKEDLIKKLYKNQQVFYIHIQRLEQRVFELEALLMEKMNEEEKQQYEKNQEKTLRTLRKYPAPPSDPSVERYPPYREQTNIKNN
jgi:hypothetical protein